MTWFRHNRDDDGENNTHGPQERDNIRNLPARIPESLTNGYHKKKDKEKLGDDGWPEFDFDSQYNRFSQYDYSSYESNYKPRTVKDYEAYELLRDYSKVFNMFPASTPYITPYSNHAIYIIDILSKLGVKFRVDVFPYNGGGYSSYGDATDTTAHRLINIIAEPNPEVTGPAIVFTAHHDVANPRSENCQDNGASVCHLLRLAALISENPTASQRTLIVFTDCEESGAKGARRFAKDVKSKPFNDDSRNVEHKIFGEISGALVLELTGHGDVYWTDCNHHDRDKELHKRLEKAAKKSLPKLSTPPSDVISFRENKFPALCIGTLPSEDMKTKATWSQCHRMSDNIEGCDSKDMKAFTEFLIEVSKVKENELIEPPSQLELELN
jgi:hypothetical protein